MQNVFFKIYLITTLLMGCASAPDTQPSDNDDDEDEESLCIEQIRGTPNQFLVCVDCPAPTQKTAFRQTAYRVMTPPVAKRQVPRKLVVHFDPASSVINDSDRERLARLVSSLPTSYRLTITGYTDNTSASSTITNETLAQQRAQSVLNYLSGLGVDKNKIALSIAPLCCYVASNATESGRAKNRRTEVLVTSLSASFIEKEGINP
jgi:outer membrane protein OmpA-like peptidoglycan-associated protein